MTSVLSDELTFYCEEDFAHGPVSCYFGAEAIVAWPLQELVLADVGAVAPHAGAPGRKENCGPPGAVAHRWRRDALFFPARGARDYVSRILVLISLLLASVSRNARGLLGSTASAQDSMEKKHRCLQRLCESNGLVCLQERHGQMNSYRRYLPFTHSGIRWEPLRRDLKAGGSATLIRKELL